MMGLLLMLWVQTEKRLGECQQELDELLATRKRLEQFIKEGQSLLLVLEDGTSPNPNSTLSLENALQARKQC